MKTKAKKISTLRAIEIKTKRKGLLALEKIPGFLFKTQQGGKLLYVFK